jgi:hypothetical protein
VIMLGVGKILLLPVWVPLVSMLEFGIGPTGSTS